MSNIANAIIALASSAFSSYFQAFEVTLQKMGRILGLELPSISETRKPIDLRIVKIDEARANLQEALSALADLSQEAERNKNELSSALARLHEARAAHASETEQLNQIKTIAQSDIDAFRRMAGIAPARERIIGFLAGIFASLVAAGIWKNRLYIAWREIREGANGGRNTIHL